MDSAPILTIQKLTKSYRTGLFKSGPDVVRGIDMEIGRGVVFGLLGPNGAGKTTLIKCALNLVGGWDGEILLHGREPGDPASRRAVGYLPEAHRLPPYLTGRQTLKLCGMLSGRDPRWLDERIDGWLDRLALSAAADQKIRTYSKGMQQRIGLAQALIHEPDLVFLDEPTDGVDPLGRAVVREIVHELKEKGVTVFINSHLLMEVEQICDRVVIMNRGAIIKEGTIDELTPRTGRVEFDIDPVPEDLEALLSGHGAGFKAADSGFEMDLTPDEQDALVDLLRAKGVSIRSMTARRLSLEESFISLVEDIEQ